MSRITNWRRESRTPTLTYRNTKTGARTVLHRTSDSYRYKWRGAVLVNGYPVWLRGYGTKEATKFRGVLRDQPAPDLSCPKYLNGNMVVGGKTADGATVQRWFECRNCGYEAPSRIVYGAKC